MIKFPCTATSKSDCHGWKLVPKKERCGKCENYGINPDCYACYNFYPRCRYNIGGQCTSETIKAQRMIKEFKEMGLIIDIKGVKK